MPNFQRYENSDRMIEIVRYMVGEPVKKESATPMHALPHESNDGRRRGIHF